MEKNEFPSQEVIGLIRSCKIEEAFRITATYIHLSAEARTILCQLLRSSHNIFLLSGYKDYIKQLADKGNPWMQYAWARFNDCAAPGPDSVTIAQEYYNKAVEAGISDARMCLAYMWRDGDFGIVDLSRYEKEMKIAADQDSHMALQQIIRDMTFGQYGAKKETLRALDMLSGYIDESCRKGIYIDPRYYTLMGVVTEEAGKPQDKLKWYKKGFEEGDLSAFIFYLYSECLNEEFEITDKDRFEELVLVGEQVHCAEAFENLLLVLSEELYNKYDTQLNDDITEALKQDLETAYQLGDNYAACELGIFYYYGQYGFEQDYKEALKWFSRGANLRSGFSYSMLALMMEEGNHPDGKDLERMHEWEIRALRLGCDDMLGKVISAYEDGYLAAYASEIEQYYYPRLMAKDQYEDEKEEEGDDEEESYSEDEDYPDDDGRFDAWS